MLIDAAAEWRRLAEQYRAMSDDELRRLAAVFGDLTDTAQQVLRSEMHGRGLGDPSDPGAVAGPKTPSAPVATTEAAGQEDLNRLEDMTSGPHEYTWRTLLRECSDYKEAWRICAVLSQAGIESWIERQGSRNPEPWVGEFMTGELQVYVAADQLEQAKAIAARPIPQEIIDLSNVETPEYVVPKCPRCGADDPMLEAVDPANQWLCEQCGATWQDDADPAEISESDPTNAGSRTL
jgi:ribosomal protein S27AE